MSKHSSDEYDDITPIFALRADNIMQRQREAYEEMLKKVAEEDTMKAMENEKSDLLLKIHEKLKKPKSKKKDMKTLKTERKTLPSRRSTRQRKVPFDEDAKEDEMSKTDDQPAINLPSHIKKKLLKIDLENKRERKRIEALNERVLNSCVSSSVDDQNASIDINTEQSIVLKINYLSDVKKITVEENEKFSSIICKVSKLFDLKVTEVTLCVRDEIISLDVTPHSLNVKAWETIDCIPCKSNGETEDFDSNYKILVKMQSNDSRKRIDMFVHKLEKFQDIMERYADSRSLPLKDLIFEFDGERIQGSDTPDELDMESGICVDVKVCGESFKSAPTTVQLIDVEKEDLQHEMLDICVLE